MLSPAEIEICKLLLHSHKNAALKIPQSKICSTESDKKKKTINILQQVQHGLTPDVSHPAAGQKPHHPSPGCNILCGLSQ